jgi:hypothetical protein
MIQQGVLIGERKTRFWYGAKFVFERVAIGERKCVYQESPIIPASMIDNLGE